MIDRNPFARLLISMGSGIAAGTAFVSSHLTFLLVAALAVALRMTWKSRSAASAIHGLAFGMALSATGSFWIWGAFSGLGAGGIGSLVAWAGLVGWIGGLPYALTWIFLAILRNQAKLLGASGLAALVYASESMASRDPWGIPGILLAYPLIDVPGAAQLAVIAGVPGVSGLMAATAYLLAASANLKGWCRVASAASASWMVISLFGVSLAEAIHDANPPDQEHEVRLLVIQPNFSRNERWLPEVQAINLERIFAFTAAKIRENPHPPDAVLWPENVLTTEIDADHDLRSLLAARVSELGVPVITGLVTTGSAGADGPYKSISAWMDANGRINDSTQKQIAIPVVESSHKLFPLDWIRRTLGPIDRWRRVEVAAEPDPLRGDFELVVLLCYEALFPQLAAQRRTPSTVAIVNLADDSWVSGEIATKQLTRFAAYRAIEQRLTFIRDAHGGLSAAFDRYGREITRAPMDEYAAFSVDVSPSRGVSAHERIAIATLFTLPGIIVWYGFPLVTTRRRS